VLDPHLQEVLKWEGDRKDFPEGPLYWEAVGDEKIKAIARGTLAETGQERREEVCTLTRQLPEEPAKETATSQPLRPDMLTAPTEVDLPTTAATAATPDAAASSAPKATEPAPQPQTDSTAVEAGEVVPPSRPEPKTFVTASEALPKVEDLGINEKVPADLPNGAPIITTTGEHNTKAETLLDPQAKN
jgi:hypothetical protein